MKTLILALGILLVGCGTTKPPEKPADPATKPADPPPADKPAGAVTFASDDEYLSKTKEMVHKMVDIFKADGTDCDKLAADISKLLDDPVVAASKAYEQTHPDAKQKFDQQSQEMAKEVAGAATPAINACGQNPALKAAFAKME